MEKIISKSSLWLVGFQSLHVQFYLVLFLILRNFKNCLNIVGFRGKGAGWDTTSAKSVHIKKNCMSEAHKSLVHFTEKHEAHKRTQQRYCCKFWTKNSQCPRKIKKVNLPVKELESELELDEGDFITELGPGELSKKEWAFPILKGRCICKYQLKRRYLE